MIAFPSSPVAGAAVPALRAASRSRCRRWSSRDSLCVGRSVDQQVILFQMAVVHLLVLMICGRSAIVFVRVPGCKTVKDEGIGEGLNGGNVPHSTIYRQTPLPPPISSLASIFPLHHISVSLCLIIITTHSSYTTRPHTSSIKNVEASDTRHYNRDKRCK